MTRMIDVVEMNEHKIRFMFANYFDGAGCGSGRSFDILNQIGSLGFEQPGKAIPVVNAGDIKFWPLVAQNAKDRREDAARAEGDWRGIEFIRLPIIVGHALLLPACAHD